jgi:hypothetical protein
VSARTAARSAFALTLALAGVALVLGVLTTAHGVTHAHNPLGPVLVEVVIALPFLAVGPLVAARRPDNPIGWLFCGVALLWMLTAAAASYAGYSTYGGGSLPAPEIAAWVAAWIQAVPLFVGPLYLLLLFPTGSLLSPRWRWAAWGIALLSVGSMISIALRPGRVDGGLEIDNPAAIHGPVGRFLGSLDPVFTALAGILFAASVAALVLRFRKSSGLERQQLKWVVYTSTVGVTGILLAFVFGPIAQYVFPIGMVGIAAMPLAAGLAILRYRLYEIDRVINRTLVYGLLTAFLGLGYLGAVLLLQAIMSSFTSGSALAVAISTLAVAALFRPARARIQDWVDRRFYRRRYDAARTLEGFSARLREEVDLDALGSELRKVVHEAMQPAHVSLWLRSP